MDKNDKLPKQRTLTQNSSIHKYCEMVARELCNQGQTMQDVIKKITLTEITPTTYSVKEIIFKPLQEATLGKKSTTQLTTAEVDQVYKIMSMFLSKQFEIDLPFPSQENTDSYITSLEQSQ